MRSCALLAVCVTSLVTAFVPAFAQTDSAAPGAVENKGMPPRAAPTDYPAHAQAGAVTIAADFTGHSIATPEGVLTAEDSVTVEVGLFGAPDARLTLSPDAFTLRINGKKALPSQPVDVLAKNLRDPEWEPPTSSTDSKKTNVTGSGKQDKDLNAPPPPPPPIPFEMRRAMELRVQKLTCREAIVPCPRLDCFSSPMAARPMASVRLS